MYNLFLFLLGTCIGSFLNVCIYRIPEGQSIIYPPSSCPNCKKRIPILYLIPVIGYFLTKGSCFNCGEKISPIYPLIELLGGILALITFNFSTSWIEGIIYYNLFMVLVAITVIDLRTMTIPDLFNIYLILAYFPYLLYKGLYSHFLSAILFFTAFFLIAVVSKGGMGGGDIKLAFTLGLYLGIAKGIVAVLLAFFIGGVIGTFLLLKGESRKKAIPFGPYLSLGTIVAYFLGERLIFLYFSFF
ncbi:prepilin peptidase [Anaerobranca gottschalkii]|uniref:Leader peptidase (Prepilin peptidase) / N-methyltransferase n=1 Tax=Anaerobranca gottschalkii DSM 13577 TaxID=1120990 RepID=A0A1H9Y4W7_9FIRM|nr:A24 family peptidase [Anaerobranca gottschalkii]SES63412.1 leader peptidase (prepilin peptidase) / N-methyltransferase [Anaerobranca gottschalkii DSM 13577]